MFHILMLWSTEPLNRYFSLGEGGREGGRERGREREREREREGERERKKFITVENDSSYLRTYPKAQSARTMPSWPVRVFIHLKLVVSHTYIHVRIYDIYMYMYMYIHVQKILLCSCMCTWHNEL